MDSLVTAVVTSAKASFKSIHSYTYIRRTSYKPIPLDPSNPSSRGEHKDLLTSWLTKYSFVDINDYDRRFIWDSKIFCIQEARIPDRLIVLTGSHPLDVYCTTAIGPCIILDVKNNDRTAQG